MKNNAIGPCRVNLYAALLKHLLNANQDRTIVVLLKSVISLFEFRRLLIFRSNEQQHVDEQQPLDEE